MKRLIVALSLVVCLPALCFGQDLVIDMDAGTQDFPIPGCGSNLHRQNVSSQLGPFAWLQYLVETSVDTNIDGSSTGATGRGRGSVRRSTRGCA